jgi:hypothetical protein
LKAAKCHQSQEAGATATIAGGKRLGMFVHPIHSAVLFFIAMFQAVQTPMLRWAIALDIIVGSKSTAIQWRTSLYQECNRPGRLRMGTSTNTTQFAKKGKDNIALLWRR